MFGHPRGLTARAQALETDRPHLDRPLRRVMLASIQRQGGRLWPGLVGVRGESDRIYKVSAILRPSRNRDSGDLPPPLSGCNLSANCFRAGGTDRRRNWV